MGTFWCCVHSGTPNTAATQKTKSVLFQSHILSAMDFRAAICWFATTEKRPTHKMYGSVSNNCAWKSAASLNGKRHFTSIDKNVGRLGDFFGLKENHLALPSTGQYNGLSAL